MVNQNSPRARDRVLCDDRCEAFDEHGNLGSRSREHGARRDRSGDQADRPGAARPHVFPLRAGPGGVLVRAGQTEAAVDLARIAGLEPAGVICEILNDDGTMARVPELTKFASGTSC